MKSISIVSKHIIHIIGISWAYHGKKTEFLNSFVSLTLKHIIHIIFTCVCPFNYLALFKDKKIIVPASQRGSLEGVIPQMRLDTRQKQGRFYKVLYERDLKILSENGIGSVLCLRIYSSIFYGQGLKDRVI